MFVRSVFQFVDCRRGKELVDSATKWLTKLYAYDINYAYNLIVYIYIIMLSFLHVCLSKFVLGIACRCPWAIHPFHPFTDSPSVCRTSSIRLRVCSQIWSLSCTMYCTIAKIPKSAQETEVRMQTNPDLGQRGFIPALKYVATPSGSWGRFYIMFQI